MIEPRDTDPAAEGFLGRWSRLKRSGGHSVEAPRPPAPAEATDEAAASAEPPLLTDADMPPVDTLDEASDFSGFLSAGVSDALRQQALRKLFGLPMCQVLDGLNDYDDDFTKLEPLGNTVTYQMKQWAERKARDLAESDPQMRHDAVTGEPAPQSAVAASEAEPAVDDCGDGDLDCDA